MPISSAQMREILSDAYAAAAVGLSLHSADPRPAGGSELAGGAPAYARKAPVITDSAVDGVSVLAATLDCPAGSTAAWVGVWSALSGGVLLDAQQITNGGTPAPQSFASQGTFAATYTYTQS